MFASLRAWFRKVITWLKGKPKIAAIGPAKSRGATCVCCGQPNSTEFVAMLPLDSKGRPMRLSDYRALLRIPNDAPDRASQEAQVAQRIELMRMRGEIVLPHQYTVCAACYREQRREFYGSDT